MAVKRNIGARELPARTGRRVALTRNGGRAASGRNRRIEPKVRRQLRVPWRSIGGYISAFGILSLLLLLLGGVAFGLVYGYRTLTAGEYFALRTLEIQGNSRLSSREILETADLVEGANTLGLSIDTVERALAKHPWVEEVSVKRVLPGTLVISLREKSPAFWILRDDGLQYADAYGRPIAPVIAGKFASLPGLEVEPGAEDSAAALPDLVKSINEARLLRGMGRVTMVRLSAARGVEVFVEGSRLKISIGLEDWLPNLRRLGMTLEDLNRRSELAGVSEIRAQGVNVWVEKRGSAS